MKLGFYGNYTKKVAEFAQRVGFGSMELSAWPKSTLNADMITDEEVSGILKDLDEKGIEISALGYYPNYLSGDDDAKEAQRYFLKVMELAKKMNVGVVATFAGRNPDKSVAENIPAFKEVFSRFCDHAEKNNVKIALENCPMMNHMEMRGENIAFSPEIWQELFRVVPSDRLGLEIDPAHLVWQHIDYIQAVYDFGHKIFHAHAKDTEIRGKILARCGIYGQQFEKVEDFGHGWWRGRAPGWGLVDWRAFITALLDVGYKGNLDIEHEDDVFARYANLNANVMEESDIINNYSTEENGLILGYNALHGLIPG